MLNRLLFSGQKSLPVFTLTAAEITVKLSHSTNKYIGYNAKGGAVSNDTFIYKGNIYYLAALLDEVKYSNTARLRLQQNGNAIYPTVVLSINGTIRTFSYDSSINELKAPKIGFVAGQVYTIKILSINWGD